MNRAVLKFCPVVMYFFSTGTTSLALLENGGNYSQETDVGPDAQTGGWFINLGITGLRGKMVPAAPTEIEVAYIFDDTPAAGLIEVGDRIVGVNGRPFTTPHKFGYGMEKFGYEGPMMDLGNALEESQGPALNGKLTLSIIRDGTQQEIELTLPTDYGQFSETYPFHCPKTEKILNELYAYIADRQRTDGSWHNRPHLNALATLALLSSVASGDSRYQQEVQRAMHFFANQTHDQIIFNGYDCWKYGLYGICLAEHYLATGEEWVLPELQEINIWLGKAQFTEPYRNGNGTGGWGHRPSNRPEGNGYGPICMITAQAMAAWSLIAECGIEISQEQYRAAHEFLIRGTNNIGYVWYADGNGGNNKYADLGRTGASTIAHAVNPFGYKHFKEIALRSAMCIGDYNNTFPDTHGSPILGMAWTALGAAIDLDSLRKLMDDHIWHFNLAHCPDGTFYYQPNRDSNPQDYHAAPRLSASAATALIFSIKHASLRINRYLHDEEPPTPNPARFSTKPLPLDKSSIFMRAESGSDASRPIEYYFSEVSGNPGGNDSGWQADPAYTDTGLTPDTRYTYTVTMRDSRENTGAASVQESATTTNGNEVNLSVRVLSGDDDAEQYLDDGTMNLNSSDLELIRENSRQQIVGIRFQNVNVPGNATILHAFIQFTVDETNTEPTSLVIRGEASDNATTFIDENGNISSRPVTEASAQWNDLPPWDTEADAGADQRTPNIRSILQEIVNRDGWSQRNSIVIIISGHGRRTAESFNGESGSSPLLQIMYIEEEESAFIRGNANATDNHVDIADTIFLLSYLFQRGRPPVCYDAADANDDGSVDLSDPILILMHLFTEGRTVVQPFPECGDDETVDQLSTCRYPEEYCE